MEAGMSFLGDSIAREAKARVEKARTLGDMSVVALLKSARNEVWGLEEYLKEHDFDVNEPMFKAYMGSILARISVAETKLGG